MPINSENVDEYADAPPETESSRVGVSDPMAAERSPPTPFSDTPPPEEVDRAVSLVERWACESPEAVSTLVDVAGTECGWWLLAELVATEPGAEGDAETPDGRGDDADAGPRTSLVESVTRFTRRSTNDVLKRFHTLLLPKLLVTDVVQHADSVAAPPNCDATVELRSGADREFVSAVLLLVAIEAQLEQGIGEFSATLHAAIERFSHVIGRIRASSRRASRPSVGANTSMSS